jgi:hypothetical protein
VAGLKDKSPLVGFLHKADCKDDTCLGTPQRKYGLDLVHRP